MWRLLRDRRLLPYKFRRQHPIGRYIADFVCLEAATIIELDGGQHNIDRLYDARRTAELEARSFRVIRFWDNDVLQKPQDVLEAIYVALGLPSP